MENSTIQVAENLVFDHNGSTCDNSNTFGAESNCIDSSIRKNWLVESDQGK